MKTIKLVLFAMTLILTTMARAEDSVSCDEDNHVLLLTDDNQIEFSSTEISEGARVVSIKVTATTPNGYNSQVDVVLDDGNDSAYRVYRFGELNRCEGETTLEVYSKPHFGTPRLLKKVSCICTQS